MCSWGARLTASFAGVAGVLRAARRRPRGFEPIGVVAADGALGAALAARRSSSDPRVAYMERDGKLRVAADPFDVVDSGHRRQVHLVLRRRPRRRRAVAAGGGSAGTIAVMDTGLDVTHPEFAGRIARTFDTAAGAADVTDFVGHGTFVTGLIAAIDGNGDRRQGRGRQHQGDRRSAARPTADFTARDLMRGIEFAVRRGADVLNLSLAGGEPRNADARRGPSRCAFFNDVLPVAASGNNGNSAGTRSSFPPPRSRRRPRRVLASACRSPPPDRTAPVGTSRPTTASSASPRPGAGPAGCDVRRPLDASRRPEPNGTYRRITCLRDRSPTAARASPTARARASRPRSSRGSPHSSGRSSRASPPSRWRRCWSARRARRCGTGWNEFTGAGIVDG